MDTVLEIKHLNISVHNQPIISDFSMELNRGEILAVVGDSGCGKTTLLHGIMGLLNKEDYVVNGEILCHEKKSIIFQDMGRYLCPVLTIGKQLMDIKKGKEEILSLLHKLNFKDPKRVMASYPFELSGGMKQRIGIAMAVLGDARILLADEPTSALDSKSKELVLQTFLQMRDELGCAIILVTHETEVAKRIADRIIGIEYEGNIKTGTD